jgi:LacI family transcriptional regulator
LNRRPGVGDATRRRVEAAMARLSYEPTTGPRGAVGSACVNVVFDTLENVYSSQVLNGLLSAGQQLGVEVIADVLDDYHHTEHRSHHRSDHRSQAHRPAPHSSREVTRSVSGSGNAQPRQAAASTDGDRAVPLTADWIRRLITFKRLGVVVVTTELTADQVQVFQDAGLPLVVIDPPRLLDSDHARSVGSTNYAGGVQAVEHLLELGHRNIAYAGGPPESNISRERLHGYRSALESADVPVRPALVRHGHFTYASGVAMATALLTLPQPPTAVFAASDVSALGVIEGARRAGLRVPEDVSVVGFDDTPAACWSAPPLTTVRQPLHEMGRSALRLLLVDEREHHLDARHIQLATRIMVRASTGPPPGLDRARPS